MAETTYEIRIGGFASPGEMAKPLAAFADTLVRAGGSHAAGVFFQTFAIEGGEARELSDVERAAMVAVTEQDDRVTGTDHPEGGES